MQNLSLYLSKPISSKSKLRKNQNELVITYRMKRSILMLCYLNGLQVVKNVASQSLEVKKLVYLYLLHYAERQADYILYLYS